MKYIIFTSFILLTTNLLAQKTNSKDSLFSVQIENLKTKVEVIEKRLITNEEIDSKTYSSISNQLSATSVSLTVIGILFGIIGIIIGVYVTYVERKIVNIRDENKEMLNQSIQIKKDVEELNRLIQQDTYGLFVKIKKEETNHILERLLKVPADITNFFQQLLSRELEINDYDKLKAAYIRLNEIEKDYEKEYAEDYLLLFFQHFADLAISDLNIKKELIDYMPLAIEQAFENDIIKSTNDLFKLFIDKGISNYKNELNKYFEGVGKSKYNDFKLLYKSIFDKLRNRDSQFLVYELIEPTEELKVIKMEYGQLLLDAFSEANPTISEKVILDEIENLKNDKTL